jgi:hypothetical protein
MPRSAATICKVPGIGLTNPHTRFVPGGSAFRSQVAGTTGEAPTLVGASLCLGRPSVGGLFFDFDTLHRTVCDLKRHGEKFGTGPFPSQLVPFENTAGPLLAKGGNKSRSRVVGMYGNSRVSGHACASRA